MDALTVLLLLKQFSPGASASVSIRQASYNSKTLASAVLHPVATDLPPTFAHDQLAQAHLIRQIQA